MTTSTDPAPTRADTDLALAVDDLTVDYRRGARLGRRASSVRVIDGLTFQIERGQTLGLVGESGCGKSTTGRAVARLLPVARGRVRIGGRDVTDLRGRELRRARRSFQMIFQDSYATLDQRMRVGDIVREPLVIHGADRRAADRRVDEVLSDVGLAQNLVRSYPHELSGGQRQRVAIARALSIKPDLIVCDEPTSALDVSVQAQVVNLLRRLQREYQVAYLFISHDLSVVRHLADQIVVMYLGKIVELTTAEGLVHNPIHPYTRALLDAVPTIEDTPERLRTRAPLPGDVPTVLDPPSGCRFRTRCRFADATCAAVEPPTERVDDRHSVACHHWRDIASSHQRAAPSPGAPTRRTS